MLARGHGSRAGIGLFVWALKTSGHEYTRIHTNNSRSVTVAVRLAAWNTRSVNRRGSVSGLECPLRYRRGSVSSLDRTAGSVVGSSQA